MTRTLTLSASKFDARNGREAGPPVIRQTRAMLEKKLASTKEEESRIVTELKTIGQPELFGV